MMLPIEFSNQFPIDVVVDRHRHRYRSSIVVVAYWPNFQIFESTLSVDLYMYICMCRVYVFTYVCANFSVRIVIRAAYQAGEACQLPRSLCAPGRIWSAAAAAANVVPELCNLTRLYIDLYTGNRPKRVCVYFDNVTKKWKGSLIPCCKYSILFLFLVTNFLLKCWDPRIEYVRVYTTQTASRWRWRRWLATLPIRLEQLLGRLLGVLRLRLRVRAGSRFRFWYRVRISRRICHSRWPNVGAFGCSFWYSSPRQVSPSLVSSRRPAPPRSPLCCVSLSKMSLVGCVHTSSNVCCWALGKSIWT